MIRDEDRQTAAMVLAKCAAADPWFPNSSEAAVLAWAEVFSESGLSREDLLAGVARAYRLAEEGFRPLPASIVRHARAAYFEQLKALTEEQRQLMEDANHCLQELNVPPPEAHRASRRVALGRSPGIELSAAESAKFHRLMAERKALASTPARPLSLDGIVKTANEVLANDPAPQGDSSASVAAGRSQSVSEIDSETTEESNA